MQAPLHAIGLLRDNLKTTGYATAINDRTGQAHTGLDVINGLVGSRRKIITFPGNGSMVRLYKFVGESPDPRESCGKDWEKFRGLPILPPLSALRLETSPARSKHPSVKRYYQEMIYV